MIEETWLSQATNIFWKPGCKKDNINLRNEGNEARYRGKGDHHEEIPRARNFLDVRVGADLKSIP